MIYFLETLKSRNGILFYFGLICFIAALIFLLLSRFTSTQVLGINAWIKLFKFAVSIFLFVWAMAWYCAYLPNFDAKIYSWGITILFVFELFYIVFQAAKGQLSHFNISTSFYAAMYSLMAFAASTITIWTAYIGLLFFTNKFPELPDYYVWSIRLGILIFVIFAFEGFVMGSRLSHTIGGADGGPGLPILNWSTKYGDPRVAHFVGMHALQVLPIVSYYLFKDVKLTIGLSLIYGFLAFYVLAQALNGKPLIKINV